jgi:hypothetical protein
VQRGQISRNSQESVPYSTFTNCHYVKTLQREHFSESMSMYLAGGVEASFRPPLK